MQKVVVQILRAPAGGIRKHVIDIIENLSDDKIKQLFITNIKESDVDLAYLSQNKNIEIFHLDIKESPGLSDIVNLIKIFFFLLKKKVDVLHGHGAKGGIYARLLSPILKAKCVYTPHGGSLHRVHGRIKNKIYDVIEKVTMPLTDVFLFESNYTADVYSKNIFDPGSKKIINYNGVDIPATFAKHIYKSSSLIKFASFGLLRHLKGHDIFIETCHLLKQKNIPFEYSIYGTGEFRSDLMELINKYQLTSEIKILDYSSSVCLEMLKFDFIVHPSRFESFGYVPVEAMSVKVPVIVSAEGGLKEIVDESTGYVSYENTPDSYLKIIEKVFQGDEQLASKVEAAYLRVSKKFSKKVMLSKIGEIYLS